MRYITYRSRAQNWRMINVQMTQITMLDDWIPNDKKNNDEIHYYDCGGTIVSLCFATVQLSI